MRKSLQSGKAPTLSNTSKQPQIKTTMKDTEIKIIERLAYGDFIIERNTGEQFRLQLRFDIEDFYQANKS